MREGARTVARWIVNLLLAAIVIGGLVIGFIVLVHLYNAIFGVQSIDWTLLAIMAGYGIVVNGLIGSALMVVREELSD